MAQDLRHHSTCFVSCSVRFFSSSSSEDLTSEAVMNMFADLWD